MCQNKPETHRFRSRLNLLVNSTAAGLARTLSLPPFIWNTTTRGRRFAASMSPQTICRLEGSLLSRNGCKRTSILRRLRSTSHHTSAIRLLCRCWDFAVTPRTGTQQTMLLICSLTRYSYYQYSCVAQSSPCIIAAVMQGLTLHDKCLRASVWPPATATIQSPPPPLSAATIPPSTAQQQSQKCLQAVGWKSRV